MAFAAPTRSTPCARWRAGQTRRCLSSNRYSFFPQQRLDFTGPQSHLNGFYVARFCVAGGFCPLDWSHFANWLHTGEGALRGGVTSIPGRALLYNCGGGRPLGHHIRDVIAVTAGSAGSVQLAAGRPPHAAVCRGLTGDIHSPRASDRTADRIDEVDFNAITPPPQRRCAATKCCSGVRTGRLAPVTRFTYVMDVLSVYRNKNFGLPVDGNTKENDGASHVVWTFLRTLSNFNVNLRAKMRRKAEKLTLKFDRVRENI